MSKKKLQSLGATLGAARAGGLFTIAQLQVFTFLAQSKPIRVTEIGAEIDLPLSTAARIALELFDSGLVDYESAPEDRRAKLVSLSDKGRELVRQFSGGGGR